jgi:hypothetical protein
MSRSRTSIILCVIAVFAECLLLPQTSSAQTASSQVSDARTACAADIQKLCAGVAPGGGRILACLKQHKDQVSNGCKQAILSAMGKSSDSASSSANPAPVAANRTPTAASPAPLAAPAGYEDNTGSAPTAPSGSQGKSDLPGKQSSRSSSAISGEHYFIMKKVQIIDQGLGKGMPAYDLLIPKDWQFKGAVNVGVAEGGCFGDWFSVVATANNVDNSMALQILPQSTWQYTDDPGGQQQMQAQNQSDMKYGMKACPVRAPVRAQDFLRQDMAKKCTGCTVVSVEPFPELAEMVRHQLGLPPTAAGANTGNTRVDAARMRIAFNNAQGQSSEAWVAAAIVVHVMPGGGRGAAYDWHAVDVMTFGTPKGQLDANEKLFKLIVSTIHPELEWEKMSNGKIASLYQMKAKQVDIQQQTISQFRQHAADVINGVTANQIKGANQASFGQDQLVRGVQTFRDPATGGTYELSNQYDHAWLNGANEYVMSDNPNFNPNGNLNGNWNQLEVVRPQP